jgi:hypothetical protein
MVELSHTYKFYPVELQLDHLQLNAAVNFEYM